jgi:hypothetical protein
MAEQMLKGEYDLGFLPANARTKENKLRSMLVDKVAKFMIELGGVDFESSRIYNGSCLDERYEIAYKPGSINLSTEVAA